MDSVCRVLLVVRASGDSPLFIGPEVELNAILKLGTSRSTRILSWIFSSRTLVPDMINRIRHRHFFGQIV
jgi:hypothetical protein